jgi:hypothetical protein
MSFVTPALRWTTIITDSVLIGTVYGCLVWCSDNCQKQAHHHLTVKELGGLLTHSGVSCLQALILVVYNLSVGRKIFFHSVAMLNLIISTVQILF